ncbi:MAG: hypothetical protein PVJ01_02995 [Pseudomonadota bacterium]|jgi:hypothetical protein
MREPITRTGIFFRTLRDCISSTWTESDMQYHIPKSRFQTGSFPAPGRQAALAGTEGGLKRYHVRGIGNCIKNAWEEAHSHYHED